MLNLGVNFEFEAGSYTRKDGDVKTVDLAPAVGSPWAGSDRSQREFWGCHQRYGCRSRRQLHVSGSILQQPQVERRNLLDR